MTANNNQDERVQQIFWEAGKLSADARIAHLESACAGDLELRHEVESLLSAHDLAGQFLQETAVLPTLNLSMAKPGDRIGRYKLLEQIGEGGFGVVWMAEQEEPVRRRVALKIIKLGMDTKEVVARFEAERQALAMMDHPSIARVFDGGATDTGRPYFVMELVRGVPITDYCDAQKLSTKERVKLFMQVCQAVQHAHQKGVIHRDIKPSNILVTMQDDQPVPKVIDFGVAKATQARLTQKTVFTRFHQWMGTPAYMSPEQAGLGSFDIDTRSDVYSLGVLLYELLTGRTPFNTQKLLEAGYDAVMRTIREEDPPKPSTRLSTLSQEELSAVAAKRCAEPAKLGGALRGELDWIVMKALEKARQRRYDTASGFARDLERYLRHEPVSAAAPSAGYRMTKYVRRNRAALATIGLVFLLLILGSVASSWQALRAIRAERTTSTALGSAQWANAASELRKRQLEAALYVSRISGACEAWEKGDVGKAEELLNLCPPGLRGWEWHYLKQQCQPELATFVVESGMAGIYGAGGGPIGLEHIVDFHAQVVFSQDGSEVYARLADGPVGRFDVLSGKSIPWTWAAVTNKDIRLASTGSRLVALPQKGTTAEVLDLRTDRSFSVEVSPMTAERLVSEDGSWLAVQATNGVELVGLTSHPVRRLIPITNQFRLHTLSPDGSTLVTEMGSDYALWDTSSGKRRLTIPVRAHPHSFTFEPSRGLLAVCGPLDSDGPGVAVWNLADGSRFFTRSSSYMSKPQFARDARWLIVASRYCMDGLALSDLRIHNLLKGEEAYAVTADNTADHPGRVMWIGKPNEGGGIFSVAGVNDVAVSPDGNLLALAVCDRTIQLISFAPAPKPGALRETLVRTVLRGHLGAVLAVKFSPDGKRLASIDQMGVVKVWDPAMEMALALPGSWAERTSVSPDATTVLWTDRKKSESHVCNLLTRAHRVLAGFHTVDYDHRSIWLLDGHRFFTGGKIWNVEAGAPTMTLDTDTPFEHVAATDDGRYLATIGGEVAIWDTTTGRVVGEQFPVDNQSYGGPYPYHQGSKLVSLTADGRKVAVCLDGEPARVQVRHTGVGTQTSAIIAAFPGRSPIMFGPQGDWLLARSTNRTFQRVEAETGKILREYKLPSALNWPSPPVDEEPSEDFSLQGWTLSPDGRYAVCFDFEADLPVIDLLSGEVVFTVGHPLLGASAAFTPDGDRLLVTGRDQRVEIWSLETRTKIVTLPQRGVFIRFTRDGSRAITISPEGQLSVLDGTHCKM